MAPKQRNSANWPSKKPGKTSGGGRTTNPPKIKPPSPTSGKPRKATTLSDVQRVAKGPTQDKGFVRRFTNAAIQNEGRKPYA